MTSEKRRIIPKAPRRPLFFLPNFPYRLFTTNAESSTSPASFLYNKTQKFDCSNQPLSSCQNLSEFEGIQEFVKHRSKWYELRLYEPVELQVEFLDAVAARLLLFAWYAIIVAALVILVIPRVQWRVVNICGSSYGVDLHYVEKWTSPCATYSSNNEANIELDQVNDIYSIRWSLSDADEIRGSWPRYRRLVISLPSTSTFSSFITSMTNLKEKSLTYRISVNVSITYLQQQQVEQVETFNDVEVKCVASRSRCNLVLLPLDFNFAGQIMDLSVTLYTLPLVLFRSIQTNSAAVGIAFQRNAYTIAVLAWRYVFIFLSMLHIIRFIAHRKYTSGLYEQSWIIIFQIALIWFLNPLFALNITNQPLPSVLAFIEYRIPTIFMAVTISFMFSVMTASIQWRSHASKYFNITMSNQVKRHTDVNNTNNNNNNNNNNHNHNENNSSEQSNQMENTTIAHHANSESCQQQIAETNVHNQDARLEVESHCLEQQSNATSNNLQSLSLNPRVPHKHESWLSRWLWGRRDYLCDPPRWTKLVALVFVALITILNIADAALADEAWLSSSNLGEVTSGFIVIHSFLLAGCVGCLGLLIYLHHTLGQKSYLESRPQQLACRVFLVVFASYIVYLIIHMCVFFFYYNGRYPVTSSLQPFLQLPMLMVSVFQVNIMTLVYTNRGHEESVPVPANDKRWYSMIWPDTWYRWLARHGGSQYIFYTERQETRFYRLQLEFRRRQHLAKLKRRNELVSLMVQENTDSNTRNQHSDNNNNNCNTDNETGSNSHLDEVLVITVETPLEEEQSDQPVSFTQNNDSQTNKNSNNEHFHYPNNREKTDKQCNNRKSHHQHHHYRFHNVPQTLHTHNTSNQHEEIFPHEQERNELYTMQFRHSRETSEFAEEPQFSITSSPILSHPIILQKSTTSLAHNGKTNNNYNVQSICYRPLRLASSVTTLRETKPSGFSRVASQRDCALEVLNMDRFSSFYLPDEEIMCNMHRGEFTAPVGCDVSLQHEPINEEQESCVVTFPDHSNNMCGSKYFTQIDSPHRHLHLSLASSQQSNNEENNLIWVKEQQNMINSNNNNNNKYSSSKVLDICLTDKHTNETHNKECNQDTFAHEITPCSLPNVAHEDETDERREEEHREEEQEEPHMLTVKEYEHHLPATHTPMFRRAFTRARRKLGRWLGRAEEVFVEEPAHTFDK